VLVLDVYKADYEPMWASVTHLLEVIATTSATSGNGAATR
jgi:hypothetical protein